MPLRLLLHVTTAPSAPSAGPVAIKYARANIMRAATSRADYYQPLVYATIGGTRRETKLRRETLTITQNLNEQPDTMAVECLGFTPVTGQEIVIGLGAPDNRIFAGHILQVANDPTVTHTAIYRLSCIDYTWELGHKRVRGRKFINTTANAIVAALVNDFAPNFSIYGQPFGFQAIDFQSNDEETVPEAISRVTKMIGADWYVDANRKVHLFTNTEAAAIAFTNSTRAIRLSYSQDMSQVRSRTTVRGQSTSAAADVDVSATSLPIGDTREFGDTGGYALVGANVITYTGRSTTDGPGALTGIPAAGDYSIRYAVVQGETVRVFSISDDAGAQSRIASTLGSGHNGIIEHAIQDGNQGAAGASDAGDGDLMQWATEVEKRLTFGVRDPRYTIGRDVTVNVTAPQTITGTFQIYTLTLTEFPIALTNVTNNLFPIRQVEAGINRRDLVGLLEPIA